MVSTSVEEFTLKQTSKSSCSCYGEGRWDDHEFRNKKRILTWHIKATWFHKATTFQVLTIYHNLQITEAGMCLLISSINGTPIFYPPPPLKDFWVHLLYTILDMWHSLTLKPLKNRPHRYSIAFKMFFITNFYLPPTIIELK